MRTYETIFIVDPDISDEDVEQITEKLKGIVDDFDGKLVKIEKWGRKKLAYKVKKKIKGNYILLVFYGDHQLTSELERNLKLDDKILKYLTVKVDDHPRLDSTEEDELEEKEEVEESTAKDEDTQEGE